MAKTRKMKFSPGSARLLFTSPHFPARTEYERGLCGGESGQNNSGKGRVKSASSQVAYTCSRAYHGFCSREEYSKTMLQRELFWEFQRRKEKHRSEIISKENNSV